MGKKINKNGFTLVECVVAIAIILVISIVAMGIYMSAEGNTSHQWNEFDAQMMAENAVPCFKSANDLTEFKARATGFSEMKNKTGEQTQKEEYTPVQYDTIRMYSDKIVFLKNGEEIASLPVNNSGLEGLSDDKFIENTVVDKEGTEVVSAAKNNNDAWVEELESGTKTWTQITNVWTQSDRSDTVSFNYYKDADGNLRMKYACLYVNKDSGSSTQPAEQGTFVYDNIASYLEQDLFDRGYILGIPSYSSSGGMYVWVDSPCLKNNGTWEMYFYLYKIVDGTENGVAVKKLQLEKNSKDKYHAICVKFSDSAKNSFMPDGYVLSTGSLHISGVYEAWVDKGQIQSPTYSTKFKDKNGKEFPEFDWGGLPAISILAEKASNFRYAPHYEDITIVASTTTVGEESHKEYTLKPGIDHLDKMSNIAYVLVGKDEPIAKFYAEGIDEPLFTYKGDTTVVKQILEDKFLFTPQEKTVSVGGVEYIKYSNSKFTVLGENEQQGYYYYAPEDNGKGCLVKVMFNDEGKKIEAWVLENDIIQGLIGKGIAEIDAALEGKQQYLDYNKG